MDAILGYLIALSLSLIGLAGFAKFSEAGVENVRTASAASTLRLISTAAERYVRDNAGTLVQGPGAQPGVQTVPFAELEAGGYVPAGVSAQNLFGQTWELRVIEPVENQLQAIVVGVPGPNARRIKETQLTAIASTAGFSGGYTPYPNMLADPTAQPTIARGAYGSWEIGFGGAAGQFGAVPAADGGALVGLLAVNGGGTSGADQFLSRRADPLNPQLNAMQTNLSMTDEGGNRNSITGANQLEGNALIGNNSLSVGGGSFAVGSGVTNPGGPCDPNVAVKIGDSALASNCAGVLSARTGPAGNGTFAVLGSQTISGAQTVTGAQTVQGLTNLRGGARVGTVGQPAFLTLEDSGVAVDGQTCPSRGSMTSDAGGLLYLCRPGEGGGLIWAQVGLPVASDNGTCTSQGGLARDNNGNTLICQAGRYIPMQSRLGSLVAISSSFHQTVAGPKTGSEALIPKPNCPAGATPRIFLQLGRANTGNATGFVQLYAVDEPGRWKAYLVDGADASIEGDYLTQIYCQFN